MKIKYFLYVCILSTGISINNVHGQSPIDFHPSIPTDTTYTIWDTHKKLIKQYPFYEFNKVKWQEASALHWVNKKSPPFFFINSSQTRFHSGCKEIVDKLNGFGVYSQVINLEGVPHSNWLFDPWLRPTVQYMVKFLD